MHLIIARRFSIIFQATRLERLRELLRIYRRRANDCDLLISYFEFAGQEHIANSLRTDLEHVLDGYGAPDVVPRFPHHLRLRKLLAGGVPRVFQHVKRENMQMRVAKMLRERADLGSVGFHFIHLDLLLYRTSFPAIQSTFCWNT
ncbi:hypothetical protein ANCCAN_27894 [Ancylostoma caninum]|uniref:Uncharacterized protein n=1 Tax=Ancylostoma caninum TaxID=29170 RepID=A0A368F5W8_ANCCA|nr:hypothetical protein ANCCAN_27894 [Ancylostoma caninum]